MVLRLLAYWWLGLGILSEPFYVQIAQTGSPLHTQFSAASAAARWLVMNKFGFSTLFSGLSRQVLLWFLLVSLAPLFVVSAIS